ncbi:MAG: ribonuclease D [Aquiluna sp.]|nr:ribonuclease D [Aquiluna sp.]
MKLDTPRSSVQYVDSPETFQLAIQALKTNADTLAIDTERASGFRYSQRAFLLQIGLSSKEIFLLDPPALDEVVPNWQTQVSQEINDKPWLLHAATQDIPCLSELGFSSPKIIDTELAARLAGFARVGLGSMVEELLDLELAKEHSASDWSLRPLSQSLLSYAALDVDVLHELWDAIRASLEEQDKMEWVQQEFQALLSFKPKPVPDEPWRNLPGLGRIKDENRIKAAAALWLAREEIAVASDLAPGRLIPDRSIMAAIEKLPRSKNELAQNKLFQGRASRNKLNVWWDAIASSANLIIKPSEINADSIPNHKGWQKRFPEAHIRLSETRPLMLALAEELKLPVENLLTPDYLRRVCFAPQADVSLQLKDLGARQWQIELSVPVIEVGLEAAQAQINSLPAT